MVGAGEIREHCPVPLMRMRDGVVIDQSEINNGVHFGSIPGFICWCFPVVQWHEIV